MLKKSVTYLVLSLLVTSIYVNHASALGRIAAHVNELQQNNVSFKPVTPFILTGTNEDANISKTIRNYTLLKFNQAGLSEILNTSPAAIRVSIPVNGSSPVELLLYKVDISPNGFTLLTSDGLSRNSTPNKIVHYRGMVENDLNSFASMSFSNEESMGLIACNAGNLVLGEIENGQNGSYVFYNDRDLIPPFSFECGANTATPAQPIPTVNPNGLSVQTVNCVNWYYETDYDIFVGKGSLANVTSYIQSVFNQVATMYSNDGINITLQTLYVWTTTDPYTGTTTSNYLNQFGAYRTSFAGDLANLVGYNGGGGIAYVNGLCSSSTSVRMGYMGISSSYNTVPTYSWTVEVITHEDGHLLGSRHTHDCVWNGNNTAIDGCGPAAGYAGSGSCSAGPIPSGGGTIMSYCHLVSAGINFNLGFGPQPLAVILNNVNNASCLSACSGCTTPAQPGTISGTTNYCGSQSLTYSIAAVGGATGYTWTLPNGWTGTSTTTSITVSASATGGTISVTANNACGPSVARTLTVTGGSAPSQPGNLIGNTSVCAGSSQTYSISSVNGATSYVWSLPGGWSGSSTTTSLVATAGVNGGTVSVAASNSCGTSTARTVNVTVNATTAQPSAISGNATICPNTSQIYSVQTVPGSNLTYNWTLPSGWSGTSTTNSITVLSNSTGGTISVTATGTCGTSSASTLNIAVSGLAPATPGTVTTTGGIVKVCPGDSRTYTVASVSGATSYTWTPPTGATITSGQGTNSIVMNFNSGFTAGDTLFVAANNACGSSNNRILLIARNNAAMPSVVTGQNYNVCNGVNIPYSVNNVSGMTYNWSFSAAGGSVVSGQGTNSITANFIAPYTTGSLVVTATNACGTSNPRTYVVRTIPPAPGAISGTTSVCANQVGVPYSIAPVTGATSYTWVVPSGARISDGVVTSNTATLTTTSNSVTVNFKTTSGAVKVKANNACGGSSNSTLTVSIVCREGESAISNENSAIRTFPNPVHDRLTVQFQSPVSSTYTINLLDLSGKSVMSISGNSSEGENSSELDVTKVSSGIYFLEVIQGAERQRTKISVQ